MKPAVESQHAWFLLLCYWSERDTVTDENRCKVMITYPDERKDERCVLNESHTEGEVLHANVPHADKDGNITPLEVGWEELRQARDLRENLE